MKISYDETETTFSTVLPPNVVGQVGMSGRSSKQKLESKGILENHEAIHETKTYDQDGYLTRTYTHTDGHARLRLPEKDYEEFKDRMPNRATDSPIVKFKLEGSSIRLIRENGEVAAEGSVDPERFRMTPEQLDSLESMQQNASAEKRARRTRQRLKGMGVSLRSLSDYHVSFTTESKENGLSSVRRVIDLRTGQPVYIVYKNEDDERSRVITRVYGRYNGVPVMRREVSYQYGPKGGKRAVVSRTELQRSNISVQFN
ncbi:MAG: hypothetical protein GVY25_09855 [Bacteroidetes bacterium]|jgi:hypothetical protein|nr:hypothetical protein [Bacteroidota bacterium]